MNASIAHLSIERGDYYKNIEILIGVISLDKFKYILIHHENGWLTAVFNNLIGKSKMYNGIRHE